PSADELTRTPYTGESPSPAPAPESTSVEAPWAWERLLVDASVIGGHDRWVRRLRGLEHEFQAKLAEAAEDESRRQHYQREIERLRSLESFALPLIEFLHGLPKQALWSEWLGLLRELARRALRSAVSVLPLFDELETMGDLGPVDLEEVAAVLRERLRFLRTPPPDRRYGQVFVASIDETATRSFDVVFLPSLAEGLFPRKPFEDPLLLDAARRKLSPDLETQSGRLLRERLRLRIAASTASQRLVVSYPRIDLATSRPRVPSFYALEVIRAAEGHLPDFRTLEKRAAAAATSRLGWPAPVDPRDALDDTEHDLSVLGPLMSRPAAEARGRARYILRANPHLARSLRARGRRWRREWFEPDGLVQADQPVMDLLAKHGFAARPYSASALQNFAQCPYKFFLQAIQRLRPREEAAPLEQIDPMTRGALIHTAQFRFFRKLDAAGQLPVHPLRVSKVLDALDATLDEVASEYAEKLAPAIPRVWRNEVESIRTDLRAWIHDCAHGQQTWKPIHFEFAFGLPPEMDRDTASVAEPVTLLAGALRLRGSIDLVETDGDTVRVTDHKTGKAPETLPYGIGGGEILQPVLYALAAEQLFHKPVHSGSLYFCTQRGAYTRADIPLRDDIRSRARFAVDTIREAIEEGFLPAAPRKGACDQCDYRPVCGPYEELRTRRKRQERLNALQQLRNTP
ncbi:MAG: PD-(D/E)XK nuclease family protein, partial [Bryobacteraceae bacterium]